MATEVFSSYMDMVYEPKQAEREARQALGELEYDTLVGTGLSGALMIPTLARSLGVNFLLIRKPTENSHSSLPAEGKLGHKWLFVDDLIASGATMRRVYDAVRYAADGRAHQTEFVGAYLYEHSRFNSVSDCERTWLRGVAPEPEPLGCGCDFCTGRLSA